MFLANFAKMFKREQGGKCCLLLGLRPHDASEHEKRWKRVDNVQTPRGVNEGEQNNFTYFPIKKKGEQKSNNNKKT